MVPVRGAALGLLLLALAALGACAAMAPRLALADRIAAGAGLARADTPGGPFTLATWSRITDPAAPLTVYIEGDGLAWLTRGEVSPDPTPTDPIALRLAALDPAANVLYVAHPCQYQPPAGAVACAPAYWTSRIYGSEAVASINAVIQAFAARTSGQIRLVGYSGGGALAVLVAAGRADVTDLRTVAGNIATARFVALHGVSPYAGSLDPADVAPRLKALPQIHFVGGRDAVTPAPVAQAYAGRMGPSRCLTIITLPKATHEQGWTDAWPRLVSEPPMCAP